MRPYETLIVLSPTLGAETQTLLDRVQEVVRSHGGEVDANHDWGSRKLSYPIQKQSEGRFFLLEYQAEGDAVAEVERTLRITDGVLRYMSVQQEHTGLPVPRPRESYRRDDVPLNELRSMDGGAEDVATDEPATAGEEAKFADATPSDSGTSGSDAGE
jgi:small subunit ribosomal protein S6